MIQQRSDPSISTGAPLVSVLLAASRTPASRENSSRIAVSSADSSGSYAAAAASHARVLRESPLTAAPSKSST
ncbi:unannotated protein [freshwater metagenome]|uniref:Unannotated protein n=1 Tax=freshwater metagenome TaxID=449393 RepID=A0A6J7LBA3_9ZZZZ